MSKHLARRPQPKAPGQRHTAMVAGVIFVCGIAALALAHARAQPGRPLFLVVSEIAPFDAAREPRGMPGDPQLDAAVARILDANVQPSFVDVVALRAAGLRAPVTTAIRFDCFARRARGVVLAYGTLGAVGWPGSARGAASVDLHLVVTSCAGAEPHPLVADTIYFFEPRRPAKPTSDEVAAAYAAAKIGLLHQLALAVARDPARASHLRRYGLALGSGERSTLAGFTAGDPAQTGPARARGAAGGWVVADVDPRGTAARAGIRAGDRIVRVNGTVATGLNLLQLQQEADARGRWDIVFAPRSGPPRAVSYPARDAAWYANHR